MFSSGKRDIFFLFTFCNENKFPGWECHTFLSDQGSKPAICGAGFLAFQQTDYLVLVACIPCCLLTTVKPQRSEESNLSGHHYSKSPPGKHLYSIDSFQKRIANWNNHTKLTVFIKYKKLYTQSLLSILLQPLDRSMATLDRLFDHDMASGIAT